MTDVAKDEFAQSYNVQAVIDRLWSSSVSMKPPGENDDFDCRDNFTPCLARIGGVFPDLAKFLKGPLKHAQEQARVRHGQQGPQFPTG